MESTDLVMVATNAFGLGVDKANIRNVLHYHVPGSLEAYAQEAGRGGRDGKPARCVLLFSPDDVAIQEYFLSGTYPTKRQVRQVFEALEAFTECTRRRPPRRGHAAERREHRAGVERRPAAHAHRAVAAQGRAASSSRRTAACTTSPIRRPSRTS